MISMAELSTLQMVSLSLLALVYGLISLPEIIKWQALAPGFVKWGYPRWWALVTPIIKLAGALCLFFPATQCLGFAICVAVALAAAATVLWHKDAEMYKVTLPAAVITIAATVAFYL